MPVLNKNSAADFDAEAMPHLNDLFRTAVRLTDNRAEAEDLVQEVYMQAWKSFQHYECGTNCRAWLFKILSNKLKHHRHKKHSFRHVEESEKVFEALAYEPPVPQQLSSEEFLASLEHLPEHYREVLLLADVEGFSYKEIAGILSIPMGTVMSRLSRGRKLLRAELTGLAESNGFREDEQEEPRSLVKFFLGWLKTA